MKRYRVTLQASSDDILKDIINRRNPEYQQWNPKDFYCLASAEQFAMLATLSSGRPNKIRVIDADTHFKALRDRVNNLMGAADE